MRLPSETYMSIYLQAKVPNILQGVEQTRLSDKLKIFVLRTRSLVIGNVRKSSRCSPFRSWLILCFILFSVQELVKSLENEYVMGGNFLIESDLS